MISKVKAPSPSEYMQRNRIVHEKIVKLVENYINSELNANVTDIYFNIMYDACENYHKIPVFTALFTELISKYTSNGWFIVLIKDVYDEPESDSSDEENDSGFNDNIRNKTFEVDLHNNAFRVLYTFNVWFHPSRPSSTTLNNITQKYTLYPTTLEKYVKIHYEKKCVICLDSRPNVQYNCGHVAVCTGCDTIDTCPMCRTDISVRYSVQKTRRQIKSKKNILTSRRGHTL